ncbi:hypothetical protein F4604DRAFT_1773848 [Suillus subluteus]|nr:hypothetical protein F4604DRAFT_1773848 [Suillus subluteus]
MIAHCSTSCGTSFHPPSQIILLLVPATFASFTTMIPRSLLLVCFVTGNFIVFLFKLHITHKFHDGRLDRFGTMHFRSLLGFAVLHPSRSLVGRYSIYCNMQSHRIEEAGPSSM